VMLGGPSASASPEMYPDIDYLHIGEMGDATDRLIACLDESVARPSAQIRFETKDTPPGPVRTFAADDPSLHRVELHSAGNALERPGGGEPV